MYSVLRDVPKKVGIKKIGDRTSLLWKTQERKDLWEVWPASPADALRLCEKKAERGAEGSSTCCPLEDPEVGPNMQVCGTVISFASSQVATFPSQ